MGSYTFSSIPQAVDTKAAFMIFTEHAALTSFQREDTSQWYVADSGCQESMTTMKQHFTSTIPCRVTIQTASQRHRPRKTYLLVSKVFRFIRNSGKL